MIPLSLQRIATVTGGVLEPAQAEGTPDILVSGAVVTDSREVEPGSLYVARVGEHADGHSYIPAARSAGAVAALTQRSQADELPCVVVDDSEVAFGAIGREVVDRCTAAGGLEIIGITGSSGKTSTKDLMAQVIAPLGPTIAPIASYNSEIGVPLTVCRLTEDTRYLIAEMGASGIGHIEYLTRIAPPRIGVVLNVGTAHLGEFGRREAIARAKAELVAALPEDGVAVLNADDPAVAAMAGMTAARVVTVGAGHENRADVQAIDIGSDDLGRAHFTLVFADEASPAETDRADVQLRLYGPHHIRNALAVAAVARELGMGTEQIASGLSAAEPRSRWRMEVHRLPGGITIVNDAYNANPDSMKAALLTLGSMRGTGGRAIAVVGEMLELGEESVVEHQRIGEIARDLGIDLLVAVGPGAAPVADGFGVADQVLRVPDATAAEAELRRWLRDGDVALLKSSRDSGLRFLGDRLVDDPPDADAKAERLDSAERVID